MEIRQPVRAAITAAPNANAADHRVRAQIRPPVGLRLQRSLRHRAAGQVAARIAVHGTSGQIRRIRRRLCRRLVLRQIRLSARPARPRRRSKHLHRIPHRRRPTRRHREQPVHAGQQDVLTAVQREAVIARPNLRMRHRNVVLIGVDPMCRRLQTDQPEAGDVIRPLQSNRQSRLQLGRHKIDRWPRRRRAVGVEQISRRIDLRVGMISRATTQPAATHHHPPVPKQQRCQVVTTRNRHRRHRSPGVRRRAPNFRHRNATRIGELRPNRVPAHDKHFPIRQHHGVVERAGVAHRRRRGHHRRARRRVDQQRRVGHRRGVPVIPAAHHQQLPGQILHRTTQLAMPPGVRRPRPQVLRTSRPRKVQPPHNVQRPGHEDLAVRHHVQVRKPLVVIIHKVVGLIRAIQRHSRQPSPRIRVLIENLRQHPA